jgi:hypothetical protein
LLSAVHLVYAASIGFVIYIRPGDHSWANIAWLLGSWLLSEFGGVVSPSPLMVVGFYLLLGGSVAAGIVAMQAVRALGSQERRGDCVWRLALASLLWGVWVPVPYSGTIFYWFEAY